MGGGGLCVSCVGTQWYVFLHPEVSPVPFSFQRVIPWTLHDALWRPALSCVYEWLFYFFCKIKLL